MKRETGRADDRPREPRSIRGWLHALIVVCTWVLFFYWWYCVLPATLLSDAAWALFDIFAVSLCTVVLTLGWVRYNLGIYRRKGPRRKIPDVSERFVVDALGRDGERRIIESIGFEAVAIQHEMDHLDGVLFLDRVVSVKTDLFRRKKYR